MTQHATLHILDASVVDFQEKVIDASHQVPVLVDFWAEWCGPCRTLKPILEKLAEEYGGRFILVKVNSDENQELAAHYGVRGIPNVKAFIKGELVDEFSGALPESQLRAFLERLLPSPTEPLRLAARAAMQEHDFDVARSLLDDALALDEKSEAIALDRAELEIESGNYDAARELLSQFEFIVTDKDRAASLNARLNLKTAGGTLAPDELRRQLEANPADLALRLQLADALALANEFRPALENLLELGRRDRTWNDEAARRRMLDLFAVMGDKTELNDLVREFRIQLARTLN